MLIAIDEIKKTADLAKIQIEETKLDLMRAEIESMFKFISQIEEVDTKDVEPLISVIDHNLVMRKDVVNDGNIAEEIVKNAPLEQEHFFLVPKVIE